MPKQKPLQGKFSSQARKQGKGGRQVGWLRKWFGLRPGANPAKRQFQERRAHPRVRCSQTIRQIGYHVDLCHMVTQTVDLSEGGLQFTSSQYFQPDEIIQLVMNLEEKNREIFFLAKVAWSRKDRNKQQFFRSGISFLQMDDDDREVLHEYIRESLPENGIMN